MFKVRLAKSEILKPLMQTIPVRKQTKNKNPAQHSNLAAQKVWQRINIKKTQDEERSHQATSLCANKLYRARIDAN